MMAIVKSSSIGSESCSAPIRPFKMARNRKQPDPAPGQPTVPPEKGIELIQRQIEAGNALLNGSLAIDTPTYQSWENVTSSFLEKAFRTHSPNVTKLTSYGKYGSFPIKAGAAWWAARRAQNLQGQLVLLAGFVDLRRTEVEL